MAKQTAELPKFPDIPVTVGISACLTGKAVRYDGRHKGGVLDRRVLSPWFRLLPECPEVGAGMGVPRPPVQLVKAVKGHPQVREVAGHAEHTAVMTEYAERRAAVLAMHVDGYILADRSPSCGLDDVPIHDHDGRPENLGSGLFTRALQRANPSMPLSPAGALGDERKRAHFVMRALTHAHWRTLSVCATAQLLDFHAAYEGLLMAHDTPQTQRLAALLTDTSGDVTTIADNYITGLMATLAYPPTREGYVRALAHLSASLPSRGTLATLIDAYRTGICELVDVLEPLSRARDEHPAIAVLRHLHVTLGLNPTAGL
ncbi:MAG: DUF523 and DUF1722 domain-containing protein [Pseudomonadales bacterium]|nr:DUF523 and DUF1722 domain-containing protein [Pseudomonadales bacterium]MDP6469823.1 DUF523 and DUF1722 domain-containing protein [Pseudomonadales bacterium]MDP6827575.1 DUF523 and DUF1722 domain-containing protein [Pseudomonadales bacterium]MDP6971293.1 DUF523 and DUF1722 domain-containing protein [Pseudomonadales bacterium]